MLEFQGVSGCDTTSRVLAMLKKENPLILCIVEKRANSDPLDRFCSKLSRRWNWAANEVTGYSEGIITI